MQSCEISPVSAIDTGFYFCAPSLLSLSIGIYLTDDTPLVAMLAGATAPTRSLAQVVPSVPCFLAVILGTRPRPVLLDPELARRFLPYASDRPGLRAYACDIVPVQAIFHSASQYRRTFSSCFLQHSDIPGCKDRGGAGPSGETPRLDFQIAAAMDIYRIRSLRV